MSWVAVACVGDVQKLFPASLPRFPRVEQPFHFSACRYCQRAPDKGQKEANCRGCGAGLTEVDKKDSV